MLDSKPYPFSAIIGECLIRKMMSFYELAEKLKMVVGQLMKECNGHALPSKALVKGVSKELGMDEKTLEKLADEVRKDLG